MMANIVVADDNPDIWFATAAALRRAGHAVTACVDGGELLETVRATAPDLVVTDNQMPVLTGLQVLAALRHDAPTAGIPVILATGSLTPADVQHQLGDSDQLLTKPFTAAQLRDAVGAALRFAGTPR